jgi:hypothetical protein
MTKAVAEPLRTKEKPPEDTETLNFRVTAAFKREFKGYAVGLGMTMVELLKEGFELSKAARKPQ